MNKWDRIGLAEARLAAANSKDPSTQVGAYIADRHHRMVSKGWNGFPRGVHDAHERLHHRPTKYALILHAEENALAFAERWRLLGATLYTWPLPPCAHCTGLAIQHGLARIVAPPPAPLANVRWGDNIRLAREIAEEAGLRYEILDSAPQLQEITP